MDYMVGRIPGNMNIDPDAGGQGHQRKRERRPKRREEDSVSISDEARRRVTDGDDGAGP